MLPLIPTLALAFFSFICSAFVILRIVIPILPPHPLSRRVPPSEFGLPNFRSLSPADKSHVWLASCDILALAIFIWQVVMESQGAPSGYNVVDDPLSAVRLWIATTLRQSCLLVVAVLTLAHVRMGHPVAFGAKHWMLWAPTLLIVVSSTAVAGVLAGSGVTTFYWGLVGYSASVAVLSSIVFVCLIGTLVIIKRNLVALNEIRDPWPPATDSEKPRPSFATEDINALKDGSSWITSHASSHRESVSTWSFTTHNTQHSRVPSNASSRIHINPAIGSHSSVAPKSSFWFNPVTGRESPVPPVPPLPAPYRPSSPVGFNVHEDLDPFRRNDACPRMGSQSSWLTEPSSYPPTISAWSFPTTREGSIANYPYPSTPDLPNVELLGTDTVPSTAVTSRPYTPAMTSADVLGGYGYSSEATRAEKGVPTAVLTVGSDVDVSVYRAIGWLVTIWVPLALALPYYFTVHKNQPTSPVTSILLVLSVSMSAPLLALNILFRSPLPIPSGLFDTPADPPSVVMRAPSPLSTAPSLMYGYKRSGSITVVEGRRSGDVWIAKGDAVEGKSKLGRAMSLLQPKPKLSVMPPGHTYEKAKEGEVTPPLPIQNPEDSVPPSPQSMNNAELGLPDGEMGMRKKDSKASSCWSTAEDGVTFAAQVMVAQKHYSTLAMTMVLPPSPPGRPSQDVAVTTGVDAAQTEASKPAGSHLRTRSVSSMTSASVPRSVSGMISPPPASPLPPTPPTLKNFMAKLGHRRSYSSINEFSFGAIENDSTREIDALSAGIVPLLLPEMRIGRDVRITGEWKMSPSFEWGGRTGKDSMQRHSRVPSELGGVSGDISSPRFHSTPHVRKGTDAKSRKMPTHKRHHFSLPSLNIGRDGLYSLATWSRELNSAFDDAKVDQYSAIPNIAVTDDGRPNTIYEGAYAASTQTYLNAVREEDEASRPASPARPYSTGFPDTLDVPRSVESARNSMATLISALDQELKIPLPPPSAASEVTLFDFSPSMDGLAESTPYDAHKATGRRSTEESAPARPPPTMNTAAATKTMAKASRRSSIKYIKSDENAAPATEYAPEPSGTANTGPKTSLAEWTRLIPKKASRLQLRAAKHANQENEAPAYMPVSSSITAQKNGLRPLSLLQDRDANVAPTRPLAIGKKNKGKVLLHSNDENAAPVKRESSFKKSLKPFRLARNDTTKERAVLREREAIPEVVVRPPSDGHQLGHAYGFR